MSKTVLFIHGAWLTPAVWAPWQARFEAAGYCTEEPAMVRQQLQKYAASPATTKLLSFPGRNHYLIAAPGWEEIADAALAWADATTRRPAVEGPHAGGVDAVPA
ncbi:hypothetical protein CJ010_02140 [Azoarcus sp. DD4]|uniref:hypothetical protein n=1 Tax=Azoarcus sp. DD4 TaxID=2027405 RepID=UPI00112B411E|nr:hypothetical protein [Azoarcus sp. DD4]QDF95436.1 hypothetical protein CJ010_02140 [Azoarcus sp. DD4]